MMVELVVPALNQSYDFQLDETLTVGALLEEMVEMLCRKEKRQLPAQGETLCLGWIEGGVLLHPEAALRDYGIADGGRLILV